MTYVRSAAAVGRPTGSELQSTSQRRFPQESSCSTCGRKAWRTQYLLEDQRHTPAPPLVGLRPSPLQSSRAAAATWSQHTSRLALWASYAPLPQRFLEISQGLLRQRQTTPVCFLDFAHISLHGWNVELWSFANVPLLPCHANIVILPITDFSHTT
jgi:hypothetical protein